METTSTLRWRPSTRVRKALLVTHVAAAGTWLGLDVVLGLLVVRVMADGDDVGAAAAALSLGAFATWPLTVVGLLTLATGLLLGTGSRYGLVRYWWVAVKLALNVVLVTLVVAALSPGVTSLAADGRETLSAGVELTIDPDLAAPPVVSSACVLLAMTLSVVKPWGRIRRRATSTGSDRRPGRPRSSPVADSDA